MFRLAFSLNPASFSKDPDWTNFWMWGWRFLTGTNEAYSQHPSKAL